MTKVGPSFHFSRLHIRASAFVSASPASALPRSPPVPTDATTVLGTYFSARMHWLRSRRESLVGSIRVESNRHIDVDVDRP